MTLEPNPGPSPQVDLPAEQPVLGEARWQEIAMVLYAALDDIDTLYDVCKSNLKCFHDGVARYHPKRHTVAKTDGYRVVFYP